jgi:hypothetical protein
LERKAAVRVFTDANPLDNADDFIELLDSIEFPVRREWNKEGIPAAIFLTDKHRAFSERDVMRKLRKEMRTMSRSRSRSRSASPNATKASLARPVTAPVGDGMQTANRRDSMHSVTFDKFVSVKNLSPQNSKAESPNAANKGVQFRKNSKLENVIQLPSSSAQASANSSVDKTLPEPSEGQGVALLNREDSNMTTRSSFGGLIRQESTISSTAMSPRIGYDISSPPLSARGKAGLLGSPRMKGQLHMTSLVLPQDASDANLGTSAQNTQRTDGDNTFISGLTSTTGVSNTGTATGSPGTLKQTNTEDRRQSLLRKSRHSKARNDDLERPSVKNPPCYALEEYYVSDMDT